MNVMGIWVVDGVGEGSIEVQGWLTVVGVVMVFRGSTNSVYV